MEKILSFDEYDGILRGETPVDVCLRILGNVLGEKGLGPEAKMTHIVQAIADLGLRLEAAGKDIPGRPRANGKPPERGHTKAYASQATRRRKELAVRPMACDPYIEGMFEMLEKSLGFTGYPEEEG